MLNPPGEKGSSSPLPLGVTGSQWQTVSWDWWYCKEQSCGVAPPTLQRVLHRPGAALCLETPLEMSSFEKETRGAGSSSAQRQLPRCRLPMLLAAAGAALHPHACEGAGTGQNLDSHLFSRCLLSFFFPKSAIARWQRGSRTVLPVTRAGGVPQRKTFTPPPQL